MHTLVDLVARIKYAATGVESKEYIHPLMAKLPTQPEKSSQSRLLSIVCLS